MQFGSSKVGPMTFTLIVFCTAIVIVSVLGGILPLATVLNHTRLQVYLSFSAGTMLGAAFFHMLPEAVRIGSPETVRWSALGLLALFFLERFFSFHHHEAHEPPRSTSGAEESRAAPAVDRDAGHGELDLHHGPARGHAAGSTGSDVLNWGSAAIGLAVHSLAGGVALASAVAADSRLHPAAAGLGVFLATLVHKPADALTITTLMLRAAAPRRHAYLVNIGFALMIPAGVGLFWLASQGLGSLAPGGGTAAALAFSAGTFLCIALSDLLPELQFHSHDRLKLSTALLLGFALMAGTALLEQSAQHDPTHVDPPQLSPTR